MLCQRFLWLIKFSCQVFPVRLYNTTMEKQDRSSKKLLNPKPVSLPKLMASTVHMTKEAFLYIIDYNNIDFHPPQLHDFAKLNENVFYVYNDIEFFKDEPQKISITCEEDIHVTEEVYKRPMFTMPAYRLFTLFLLGHMSEWQIYS